MAVILGTPNTTLNHSTQMPEYYQEWPQIAPSNSVWEMFRNTPPPKRTKESNQTSTQYPSPLITHSSVFFSVILGFILAILALLNNYSWWCSRDNMGSGDQIQASYVQSRRPALWTILPRSLLLEPLCSFPISGKGTWTRIRKLGEKSQVDYYKITQHVVSLAPAIRV